jgi:hypothetical protein
LATTSTKRHEDGFGFCCGVWDFTFGVIVISAKAGIQLDTQRSGFPPARE